MDRKDLAKLVSQKLNEATVDYYRPTDARQVIQGIIEDGSLGLLEVDCESLSELKGFFWIDLAHTDIFENYGKRFSNSVKVDRFSIEIWEMAIDLSNDLNHPILGPYFDDLILFNKEEKGPVSQIINFDFKSHYIRIIQRYLGKIKWLWNLKPTHDCNQVDPALTDAIERTSHLCCKYYNKDTAFELLEYLRKISSQYYVENSWRWILPLIKSFTFLVESKKVSCIINKQEIHEFYKYAVNCASGFSEPGGLYFLIPYCNRLVCTLAKHLSVNDAEEIEYQSNINLLGKVASYKAKYESNLSASMILNNAIIIAKKKGDEKKVLEFSHTQMMYMQKEEKEDEVNIHEFELRRDNSTWEIFLSPFQGKLSPEKSLSMWISHPSFVPDYRIIHGQIQQSGFLSHLILPPVLVGNLGNQISSSTSEDTSVSIMASSTARLTLSAIASMYMIPTLDYLKKENKITDIIILEKITTWSLLYPDNKDVVIHGIKKHFEKDYISSVYILALQFESLLRRALYLAGVSDTIDTTYSKKGGVQQSERTLGSFLKRSEVVKILGPELSMHYRFIFTRDTDLLGLNLRNDVAHGIIQPHLLNEVTSTLVLHSILLLTTISMKGENDEKN